MYVNKSGCIYFSSNPVIQNSLNGTWECTAGCSLVPGIYIGIVTNTNPPAVWNNHLAINGSPFNTGSCVFTVRATKSDGTYCEKTFTLTVLPPRDCDLSTNWYDNPHLPDWYNVGQHIHYQFRVVTQGFGIPVNPVWSVDNPKTFPPGLTFSSSGLLSGTITDPGPYWLDRNGGGAVIFSDDSGYRCLLPITWIL